MDIKVDLNTNTAEKLVEQGIQAKILEGAVGVIIKELTPDRLQAWVLAVFQEATKVSSRQGHDAQSSQPETPKVVSDPPSRLMKMFNQDRRSA